MQFNFKSRTFIYMNIKERILIIGLTTSNSCCVNKRPVVVKSVRHGLTRTKL